MSDEHTIVRAGAAGSRSGDPGGRPDPFSESTGNPTGRPELRLDRSFAIDDGMYCIPSEDGHCTTCSDEALQAKVLSIDEVTGLALVEMMAEETSAEARTEEIDISLVENIVPGDFLLVHGGVAIGIADL